VTPARAERVDIKPAWPREHCHHPDLYQRDLYQRGAGTDGVGHGAVVSGFVAQVSGSHRRPDEAAPGRAGEEGSTQRATGTFPPTHAGAGA